MPLSAAGRLRPLPLDTGSAAKSRHEKQQALCQLIDMGAFCLAEFADTQCRPIEGAGVHGGMHVLQILAPSHTGRLPQFPPLSQSFKV